MMKEVAVFEAHDSYVLALAYSSDGSKLVSAGMDNVVKVWSVPDWQAVGTLTGHTKSVNTMALSPDERQMVTGSSDCTVRLWTFPGGHEHHTLQDRKQVVAAVAYSHNGQWIAAGSYGGRAMVWTASGKPVVGIKASKKNLASVAFAPDRDLLATSGLGNDIRVWALPSGDPVAVLPGHQIAVSGLNFLEGGRVLLSLGYEQAVRFWDTGTWQEVRQVRPDREGIRGLLVSPDESTVALSYEGLVQFWSLADWTLHQEIPVDTKAISSMAFSPNGRWFAVGGADRRIRVWDPAGAN